MGYGGIYHVTNASVCHASHNIRCLFRIPIFSFDSRALHKNSFDSGSYPLFCIFCRPYGNTFSRAHNVYHWTLRIYSSRFCRKYKKRFFDLDWKVSTCILSKYECPQYKDIYIYPYSSYGIGNTYHFLCITHLYLHFIIPGKTYF